MTDDVTNDTTEAPAAAEPAAPAPEERAFEQLTALIALITDAEAVKSRLAELRKLSRELARARLKFGREESAHTEVVRRDREALEVERKELAEREHWLARREAQVEAQLRPPNPHARPRHFPGGMTAEPDDDIPTRASDPHFGRQSVTAADEGMVLEKVGPSTGTLTRSVPRPRKTLRRVQPDA
jgi:hypothetical protein